MALLKATTRSGLGTRKAKAVRSQGKIPGIIYGHGQTPSAVSLDQKEVQNVVKHGERLLEVELEGQTQNVLIKEVQYNYLGNEILHIDLTRVNLDERVEVTVAITLRGIPAGATEGGVLQQVASDVTIECTVRSIPDEIRVSVADMKVGDKLTMKDLPLPEGAKLMVEPEILVASISLVTEKEEVTAEEAAVTPEVIGEKKEEAEGEAEKK